MHTVRGPQMSEVRLAGTKRLVGLSGKGELRRENRRIVLETLFHRSKASRIELVRMTGLSPSTVGQIVGELIEDRVLVESGAVDLKRGRKPRLLEINPDAGVVVGIELSGRTAAAFDLKCNARTRFGALVGERALTPDALVRAVADVAARCRAVNPPPVAIGVSVPGTVDSASGRVITSTPLGWTDVPLGPMLTEATGLPAIVQPNMVSLVLEEAATGIAQDVANFVYLHLGMRGIAAGIAVNGSILRGAHLNAGEIGHVQVDPEGPPCNCGKRGCLGVVASGEAVLKAAQQSMKAGGAAPASISELTRAAAAGDPIASSQLERAGETIGAAVAAVINLVNPELIAVGGAFAAQAAPILLPVIERTAIARSAFHGSIPCSFKLAEDASRQSAKGAARAAVHMRLMHIAAQ